MGCWGLLSCEGLTIFYYYLCHFFLVLGLAYERDHRMKLSEASEDGGSRAVVVVYRLL